MELGLTLEFYKQNMQKQVKKKALYSINNSIVEHSWWNNLRMEMCCNIVVALISCRSFTVLLVMVATENCFVHRCWSGCGPELHPGHHRWQEHHAGLWYAHGVSTVLCHSYFGVYKMDQFVI